MLNFKQDMIDKPVKDFQDLIVWKKSHLLVLLIHQYKEFSKKEMAGLIAQLRQLIVSPPTDVKAPAKIYNKDKVRFHVITEGSAEECSYHLILSTDRNYGENLALLLMMEEKTSSLKVHKKLSLESAY